MDYREKITNFLSILKQPSVVPMVIANLLVLVGVIFWHYSTGMIFMIYLAEIWVVCLFSLIKIIIIDWKRSFLAVPIFLLFYSIIILTTFGLSQFLIIKENINLTFVNVGILALSHLLSLVINFIGRKEYLPTSGKNTKFDLILNEGMNPVYSFCVLCAAIFIAVFAIIPIVLVILLVGIMVASLIGLIWGLEKGLIGLDWLTGFYGYCTASSSLSLCLFNSWVIIVLLVITKTIFSVVMHAKKHSIF